MKVERTLDLQKNDTFKTSESTSETTTGTVEIPDTNQSINDTSIDLSESIVEKYMSETTFVTN